MFLMLLGKGVEKENNLLNYDGTLEEENEHACTCSFLAE